MNRGRYRVGAQPWSREPSPWNVWAIRRTRFWPAWVPLIWYFADVATKQWTAVTKPGERMQNEQFEAGGNPIVPHVRETSKTQDGQFSLSAVVADSRSASPYSRTVMPGWWAKCNRLWRMKRDPSLWTAQMLVMFWLGNRWSFPSRACPALNKCFGSERAKPPDIWCWPMEKRDCWDVADILQW